MTNHFKLPIIIMRPFKEELLNDAHNHAKEEYPDECCGIILGKTDNNEEDVLYPCKNIQNRLHEQDPKSFPRSAKTAFYIDPRELMGILREAETKGLAIKTFYHSHPDHDAYFSDEDRRMALFDNEPSYPNTSYLVISIYNREIKDNALFCWDPETGDFKKQVFIL